METSKLEWLNKLLLWSGIFVAFGLMAQGCNHKDFEKRSYKSNGSMGIITKVMVPEEWSGSKVSQQNAVLGTHYNPWFFNRPEVFSFNNTILAIGQGPAPTGWTVWLRREKRLNGTIRNGVLGFVDYDKKEIHIADSCDLAWAYRLMVQAWITKDPWQVDQQTLLDESNLLPIIRGWWGCD